MRIPGSYSRVATFMNSSRGAKKIGAENDDFVTFTTSGYGDEGST